MSEPRPARPEGAISPKDIDVNEYGAEKHGERQAMNRRLFMQLLVFSVDPAHRSSEAIEAVGTALKGEGVATVIYADVSDPRSIGVLTWSEDPSHFVLNVRPVLDAPALSYLTLRPDFTMTGRTYSSGYEQDLEYWILRRPAESVSNPDWPWAIWYPLRRSGAFESLEPREQGKILREHAIIGRAYGEKDLAHDVRLACHGLDTNDSDFVIGLLGKELHPLSHVVQSMRKTKQTREYLTRLGPFFVGHAVWRS